MFPFPSPLLTVGGGAVASIFRAQNIQAWSSSSSQTVTIPSGAVAGDTLVLFIGASFSANLVSGFTSVDSKTGTNWNGSIQSKVLTSGDISTGSFTVTFTGSHAGTIWAVALVGSVTVRSVASQRQGGTFGSPYTRTVTTDGAPVSGDLALYFGSVRTSGDTITTDRGTASTAQTNAVSSAGGRGFKDDPLSSSGAITVNFTYTGTTSNGDYSAILVVHA